MSKSPAALHEELPELPRQTFGMLGLGEHTTSGSSVDGKDQTVKRLSERE